MARNRDDLADSFEAEESGGWLTNFLADEGELDRRAMWRLGSWGVGSVAAITVAILASQSSSDMRREQSVTADLARQTQQIQRIASESQKETKRLSSAVDTLNGDRDRLFSRVATLEQGLETVTGSIARQPAVMASQSPPTPIPKPEPPPTPAPKVAAPQTAPPGLIGPPAPVAATAPIAVDEAPPATPTAVVVPAAVEPVAAKPVAEKTAAVAGPALMPFRSMMAPPDAAAAKLIEPAPPAETSPPSPLKPVVSAPAAAEPDQAAAPAVPVNHTEFGIDLGGANSIDGLRVLWQRLSKSNKALGELRPIIVLKERANGLGMQLRLVAGPLSDAAAAARICATMAGGEQSCETSVFDGQRLSTGVARPAPATSHQRWSQRRRSSAVVAPPKPEEPPAPPKSTSLSSLLGLQ